MFISLKTAILACALLAALFFGAGTSVLATDPTPIAPTINYTPLAPLPETGPCSAADTADVTAKRTAHCLPTEVKTLGGYLRGVYILGVALAGLLAVFSIVRGGFELLFTDSILGHSEGKGIILRALGGLLIVYSSYILMNTINPQLGRDLNLELKLPQITVERGVADQLISWTPDLPDFDESARQEILAKSSAARVTIADKDGKAAQLRKDAEAPGLTQEQRDAKILEAMGLEAESWKAFGDAAASNSGLNQAALNRETSMIDNILLLKLPEGFDPAQEQRNLARMQSNLSKAASELGARDELGLATQVLREQVQQGNSMREAVVQHEMHNTVLNHNKTMLTIYNSNRAVSQMSAMVSDTDAVITRLQAFHDRADATQTVRVQTAGGGYENRNAREYISEQITNMRNETKLKIGNAKANCAPAVVTGARNFPCAYWQPPPAYR